jgi:hypothetical protein
MMGPCLSSLWLCGVAVDDCIIPEIQPLSYSWHLFSPSSILLTDLLNSSNITIDAFLARRMYSLFLKSAAVPA